MTLSKLYNQTRPALSFELFPPKTKKGEVALYRHVEKLMTFAPDFITCTYGAGGSTQQKTLDICENVKNRFQVPVASHLTLVDASIETLVAYLEEAKARGVDYIVALRGDPPQGETTFRPIEGGMRYANELVELINDQYPDFEIAVAGYPEKHFEAENLEIDLQNLKRKVDAGADVVITQLFYDNADFFRFRDRCDNIGLDVPLVPGILPVTNLNQIQRITSLCGARLPDTFVNRLNANADDAWQFEVGVEFAVAQVQELVNNGAAGIHFYVLNKSEATSNVLETVSLPV